MIFTRRASDPTSRLTGPTLPAKPYCKPGQPRAGSHHGQRGFAGEVHQRMRDENPADMPRETFIDHFGWTDDGGFAPYVDGLTIDAGPTGDALVNAITQKGTLDEWLKIVRPLMDNIYLRLTVAASLAAPLLEIIKGLPYVFHLWGGTGSRKNRWYHGSSQYLGQPQFGAMVPDNEHDGQRPGGHCINAEKRSVFRR